MPIQMAKIKWINTTNLGKTNGALKIAGGNANDTIILENNWQIFTKLNILTIRSDQSLSRVRHCDPMNCSTPGLPVHHQLPEFTQTHVHGVGDAIQPSHPLLPPLLPTLNHSQHQGLFHWVSSSQDHNQQPNSITHAISTSFRHSGYRLSHPLAGVRTVKDLGFSHLRGHPRGWWTTPGLSLSKAAFPSLGLADAN